MLRFLHIEAPYYRRDYSTYSTCASKTAKHSQIGKQQKLFLYLNVEIVAAAGTTEESVYLIVLISSTVKLLIIDYFHYWIHCYWKINLVKRTFMH